MAELIAPAAESIVRDLRSKRRSRTRAPRAWFLWITAGVVALAILLPLLYLILRGAEARLGELWLNANTLAVLARTAGLSAAVTVASALLAVPLAWLTVRTDLPFSRLWSVLGALPLVIPSYVGAYLLVASLGPRGVLARWLEGLIGIERLPSIYGFPGALLVLTLLSYPYIFLTVRAALQRVDPALEEAARSLGTSPWMTFMRVTLPQLRPALTAGGLLVALYVLRDFGAVSILRYNTFTRIIYLQYKSSFDRSAAAGLALLLVALTALVLAGEYRSRRRARYYAAANGGSRPPTVISLGRWRWPALALFSTVVLLALVIPSSVLVYWLARGWQLGVRLAPLWEATQNSLLAASLAAGTTLAAALPFAILSVRFPGRLSSFLERLAYAAYALPGIVVALALVFFGANFAPIIYQTLPILILAYVILFVSQAVGAVRTALLQIHPSLEEAALGLGRSPRQVFAGITLPLMRPGVLAAISLVFLTAMKELPATLILSPFGFRTLATSLWSTVSEAYFAQAAAPALLLILVSCIPMAVLTIKETR